jgi:hypothetical protein
MTILGLLCPYVKVKPFSSGLYACYKCNVSKTIKFPMTKRLTQILFTFGVCLFASHSFAQTLSCQQKIYVSMDATCSATITPAMIASTTPPVGAVVTIMNGTTVIPQPLTAANIGKLYTVKLAVNGNSCWGTAKLEDKAAPVLTCALSPQNVNCAIQNLNISLGSKVVFDNIPDNGITDINIASGIFGNPAVAENCGLYTLSYSDNVDDKDCSALGLSAVVARTWTAVDAYNNSTQCTVVYNLQRQPLSSVVFPSDITLSCSTAFATDINGNPAVGVTKAPQINGVDAYPTMAGFCEINTSYHDVKVNTCGTTYEILRKWTVIDMCNFAVSTKMQIVRVLDNEAPRILDICPLNDVTVTTNAGCVLNNYAIPSINTTDNCDATPTITAIVSQGGLAITGGLIVSNLAIGSYVITYVATDDCGNSTSCTRNLYVKDLTPPVAICDLNTKVAVNSAGKAFLPATSINDNSLDNCCLDVSRFEIKRVSEPDAAYKTVLELNCSDVQLMVALRVWDCNQNSNVCMVNVIVEDKLPPVAFGRDTIVCCGNTPAATAWLNAHPLKEKSLVDYPSANNSGYYDNCGATPAYSPAGSIDNCGNGTVKYNVTVTDAKGLTATTTINYISENRSAYTVTFPADVTMTCTDNKQYATDPASAGKPDVKNLGATCPLVGVEYTDNIFKVVPGACFKIIRTWKVLNWCQPQANFNGNRGDLRKIGTACALQDRTYTNIDLLRPDRIKGVLDNDAPCRKEMQDLVDAEKCYTFDTDGYMEYQQVIKVIDLTTPTLTAGKVTLTPVGKLCKTKVTIEKPTSTDCTGATLDSYEILKFGSNTFVAGGNTFPVEKDFSDNEFGDYIVRFKTTDQCGNYTSTDVKISIKDVTKPTPICHDWIAVELMANGMVMLDAKIVDAGSYDNCTVQNKLKFKLQSPAPSISGIMPNPDTLLQVFTFSCAGEKIIPTDDKLGYLTTVALWVGDEAGNWDYCETVVNVQDNMIVCNYIPIQMKNLAGAIVTEKNINVENVKMSLDGTKKQQEISNITGKILFKDLPIAGNYTVVPEKKELPLNGVSTLDLVLMSKHILATQPFTTPYQMIAADVNKNGAITTADLVELRKMILGIQTDFTKNTSWRFIDKAFSFAANQNPLQQLFPETKTFTGVNGTDEANFIAVKIGDVNGNATANGNAAGRGANQILTVSAEEKTYNVGDEVRMTLTAEKAIEAYQLTLNYEKNNLKLLEIQGNTDNFAVLEDGTITVSTVNSTASSELFTLVFKAKKQGLLSENAHISSQITSKEAYDNEGRTYDLALDFTNKSTVLELFQNRPNPFQNETTIAFNLPKAGTAKITISDIAGKTLQVIENDFAKGYNELKINKSTLQVSGVTYLQLEQNGQRVSKKMVIIE